MIRSSASVNCWCTGWSISDSTPPLAHTLITLALRRSCSLTARAHAEGPSASAMIPSRRENSSIHDSGYECRSPCPPVVLSTAPAPYTEGPSSTPSATTRASSTPSPPTSRTDVTPASSAARRSRADRAARTVSGSSGSWPRSNTRVPRKWPWQSHSPGMTAAAVCTCAAGVAGAVAAGPA